MTLSTEGNKLGDIHVNAEYYWRASNATFGIVPCSVLMGSDEKEIQWRLPKRKFNTAM